ncbi:MAG: hypothetical protein ABGZ49_13345 [Akkermansiaceae bacterium]
MILEDLQLWHDPIPRSGPENMAVDEWLLEREEIPLLRVYDWLGDWVSLGYFGQRREAEAMMGKGVPLVRRATGGGIVDHRIDRTYSLVVPKACELARRRGTESYRAIHTALAAALHMVGVEARLITEDSEHDSAACFEKSVAWDIADGEGNKLAGAGQRRTRSGLLHQGSVVVAADCRDLFVALAEGVALKVVAIRREPSEEDLAAMIEKFQSGAWLERR